MRLKLPFAEISAKDGGVFMFDPVALTNKEIGMNEAMEKINEIEQKLRELKELLKGQVYVDSTSPSLSKNDLVSK